MTREEAVKTLKTDGCYECSVGCSSPYHCNNASCDVREATRMAIESLGKTVCGEWLEDGEGEIYCSKCGKYTYDRHDEIKKFDGKTVIALCYPRYCGNCGANMRGGTK